MAYLSAKFASRVQQAMQEQNIQIKDLAERTESVYEHARKIVKGDAFPSKHLLKLIATTLKLELAELEGLIAEDRVKRKYGAVASVLAGIPPRIEPLLPFEPFLTDQDIRELVAICEVKKAMNSTQAGD